MKRLWKFTVILLPVILLIGIVQAAAPVFTSIVPPNDPSSDLGATQDFTVQTDQNVTFTWYINGSLVQTDPLINTSTYSNNSAPVGTYNVTVIATNLTDSIQNIWNWTVNAPPPPSIQNPDPSDTTVITYNGSSQTFSIEIDRSANATWYLDGVLQKSDTGVTSSSFTNTSPVGGPYNVTVNVEDQYGSDSWKWDWSVIEIPPPSIIDRDPPSDPEDEVNTDRQFSITSDQWVNVTWLMNGTEVKNQTLVKTSSYNNSTAPIGTYNITVNLENVNGTNTTTWIWSVVPVPVIFSNPDPSSDPSDLVDETRTFYIELNQACKVEWFIDGGSPLQTNDSPPVTSASFTTSQSSSGTYIVEALATNTTTGASNTYSWTWKVNPKTYYTGDRIWEGQSTTYTWTPQSFGGFYYNLDTDEGTETLKITDIGRTIDDKDIEYKTEPIEVDFERSSFGTYYVIGFMAERYFAGYKSGPIGDTGDSLLDEELLSKVLIDDDDSQMIRAGTPLELAEGYDFRVTEFGATGDDVMVALFKDGERVHETIISEGDTYVYKKDLGRVDNFPVIAIHIKTVFRGMETSSVSIDGIFQISDKVTEVERGTEFGLMRVDSVNANQIIMHNPDSVSLKKGRTFNLMGKINIQVGDSDTLRFAPVQDLSEPGTYELRGTVTEEDTYEWTPLNFEGLLYDMDRGEGKETLKLTRSGRTVDENDLVYTTKPISMSFEHGGWGTYDSIGFMGEKYFAGYPSGAIVSGGASLMEKERLGTILMDENDKHTLHVGNSLTLEEGYSLRIDEISRSGNAIMITLLKDGEEMGTDIINEGTTYTYSVEIDKEDIPIIAVYVDKIFRGMETNSVFIKGIFQISEDFRTIQEGDTYGKMTVTSVTDTMITMKNDDSFSLSRGSTVPVMGNINFKVADSSTVRFYPFEEVVVEEPLYLELDIPTTAYQNEYLTITVTSDGDEVQGAVITLDDIEIGTTDSNGELIYTPAVAGTFTITASKSGYESASEDIDILYQPKVLEITAPLVEDRGNTIVISVTSEGKGVSGASVKFGSKDLGTTPSSGNITYTPDEIGSFTITASKTGYQDATASIDITDPGARLVFSNLTIKPRVVQPGENVNITVEASNFGTLRESQTAFFKINGQDVAKVDLVMEPGEITTLSFSVNRTKPGTYLVEVDGRSGTFRVAGDEMSATTVIVLGIIVVLSATAAVYAVAQGTLTFGTVTAKAQALERMLRRLVEK